MVQRGHHFAIVDEVDSILIDEARTPLIISGPSEDITDLYYEVDRDHPEASSAARSMQGQVKGEDRDRLEASGDFVVDEKNKTVHADRIRAWPRPRNCSPTACSPAACTIPRTCRCSTTCSRACARTCITSSTWTT